MIEPNPSHKPHAYKPASAMSPAGLPNRSIAASGGQVRSGGQVDETPSMDTSTRTVKPSPDIRSFTPLMD